MKVGDLVRIHPSRPDGHHRESLNGLVVSNDLMRLSFVPDRVIVLWQNGVKEAAVPDHLEVISEAR